MPNAVCGVGVDPQGQVLTVDITNTAGTRLSAYTTEGGTTAISLPATIAQRTKFFLPTAGNIVVSVRLNGQEIADGFGRTLSMGVESGQFSWISPTVDAPELSATLPSRSVFKLDDPQGFALSRPGGGTFTKQGIVFTPAQSGLTSIYWPWVLKVSNIISKPLDKYYMWYSTDHDTDTGGIGLATASSPLGPWTARPGNPIYIDPNYTGAHGQTETPSVIWNESTSLFHMYYQQQGVPGATGTQSTCVATSRDGITWTRIGLALDIPSTTGIPGDGHTGYFRPFRIGNLWSGYSLCGGSGVGYCAIWYSADGLEWQLDPRLLAANTDLTGDDTLATQINWNQCNVVVWRGRLWLVGSIGGIGQFGAPDASNTRKIVLAPISANGRRMLGRVEVILEGNGPSESTDIRSVYAFVDNGVLYVYYKAGAAGLFFAATAGV